MIPLRRSLQPQSLQRNAATWADALCRARQEWYRHGCPGKRPAAHRSRYASQSVRRALLRVVGAKCWYCEQDEEAPHVEHFRPQAIYPALAYRWTNFLLACATCNATFKGLRFPLGPHAQQPEEDPLNPWSRNDSDEAMLLNPCDDDPALHLHFDDGRALARTQRGAITESTLGLNREWLTDARRIHLRYVHLLILAMETAQRIDDPRYASYAQALREMADDRSRFAGMVRIELTTAGYDWRDRAAS